MSIPGARGRAGRGGDGRRGFQTDAEVILGAMLGEKAGGVLKGLMGGIFEKRELVEWEFS